MATNRSVRQLYVRLLAVPRRKLLTFANSRRFCETIAEVLDADPALKGVILTHYSSLAPATKEETEQQFAAAPRAICVATSTLEMGIDIGDIDAVVLFGVPFGIESFLQRIGRGNRRSNKTNAICLVTDGATAEREALVFATMVDLARQGRLPARRPERLYGAAAQQCLSIIQGRDGGFTRIADLTSQVAFADHLDRAAIESILAELASHELLQKHGFKNQYGADDGLWELCDQGVIWGNYPLGSQTVDVSHGRHILGSIPRTNLLRLRWGSTFRFGGNRWRIREIDSASVQVEPTTSKANGVEVTYGGGKQRGMDTFLSRRLWNVLFSLTEERSAMEHSTWARVASKLDAIRSACTVTALPWSRTATGIRYYTFGGLELNQVLVNWIAQPGAKAVDFWIEAPNKVDWESLEFDREKLLPHARAVFTPSDQQTFYQQILPTHLQTEEWLEGWLKDDDIRDTLESLSHVEQVQVSAGLLSFLDTG
jgi:ATP-dependent Lhr-like helicase